MDKKDIDLATFKIAIPGIQTTILFDVLKENGLITNEEFNLRIDKLIDAANKVQNFNEEDLKILKERAHMK